MANTIAQACRPINASEIRRRLTDQFGGHSGGFPDHLVLFEVGARQSDWQTRRIDAVAVGLTKRSDYLIHGFEIKISRGDLRSEFNDPTKASGQRFCDRWWLALSSIDLLHDGDPLPDHWGVIACTGRRLSIYRKPQPIARIESPQFRAALLHAGQRAPGYRRAMGIQLGAQRAADNMRREIQKAYQRGLIHGRWAERAEQEGTA